MNITTKNTSLTSLHCTSFNSEHGCEQSAWHDCGYAWLQLAPIYLFVVVWIGVGAIILWKEGSITNVFELDASKVHDRVVQGIAIALAQRKYDSEHQERFQRYVRLCAMCAEWPSFTLTPLAIAFKFTGTPWFVNVLAFYLNFVDEDWNVALTLISILVVIVLRQLRCRDEVVLERYVYPTVFDLFYIPIASTLLRMGTCPPDYQHTVLPGGITCDCVDHFGIFWAIGFIGFIALYWSALQYKMYIEPQGKTIDFHFQPSFQFVTVMARTLDPIAAILVDTMDSSRGGAMVIVFVLLIVSTLLLIYSYKSQPCIGSGRVPNNLRVVTFSSAIYTALIVLGVLMCQGSLTDLYYLIIPLPLIWIVSWHVNSKRADCYHIPGVAIHHLLEHSSEQAQTVGAIAALHMDPQNVHHRYYHRIIVQLEKLAMSSTPHCRLYAIRTLWFCHIESGVKIQEIVGKKNPINKSFWCKDSRNPSRLSFKSIVRRRSSLMDVVIAAKRRTEISSHPWDAFMNGNPDGSLSSSWLQRIVVHESRRLSNIDNKSKSQPQYHIMTIDGKNWLSQTQLPSEALGCLKRLFRNAMDVLLESSVLEDHILMEESSKFLLQWFRSGYLQLSPAQFLQLLTTICAGKWTKTMIDAAHSLFIATNNDALPVSLWLEHPFHFNLFTSTLAHKSSVTVMKCAQVIAKVLEEAEKVDSVNLFMLVTPPSTSRIHVAFHAWPNSYTVSEPLERVILSLQHLEIQQKPVDPKKLKLVETVARASAIFKSFRRENSKCLILPEPSKAILNSTEISQTITQSNRDSSFQTEPKKQLNAAVLKVMASTKKGSYRKASGVTPLRNKLTKINGGTPTHKLIFAPPVLIREVERRRNQRARLKECLERANEIKQRIKVHKYTDSYTISVEQHSRQAIIDQVRTTYAESDKAMVDDYLNTRLHII
ncbi:hypothetical protein THRCLA_05536 [Thraustotheca clavata]|uniref:Transmembrane protein n=1 Tax=Thraustotheca clavata TaxID=74557 RepID=A0A1V9ZVK6_9STRA|nr:hypothetical protein THRCLA_05536 [Thraustotheca clavata]